jgi:hypothetical protein
MEDSFLVLRLMMVLTLALQIVIVVKLFLN